MMGPVAGEEAGVDAEGPAYLADDLQDHLRDDVAADQRGQRNLQQVVQAIKDVAPRSQAEQTA